MTKESKTNKISAAAENQQRCDHAGSAKQNRCQAGPQEQVRCTAHSVCGEDSEKRSCMNRILGNKKDDFCRYTKHESARERRGAETE